MFNEIYEEPEEVKIPEKYQDIVAQIADELIQGNIGFFNPDTQEHENIPKEIAYDSEEFEIITGQTWEDPDINHDKWDKCIEIKPMSSHDSFQIMEAFTDIVDNKYFCIC